MKEQTSTMRNSWRITTLMLTIIMLATTLLSGLGESITAQAATTAYGILSSSKYAKVYTLSSSGTTIPYTSSSLTTRGSVTNGSSSKAYIANSTDELYVKKVGTTNGKTWALVSYPTSKKRLDAYIYLSAISSNNGSHAKTTSRGKFYCYPRYTSSSTSTSYYVAGGDTVYLLATSGSKYQIMYNVSNGQWRIAWCNKSDYQRYCTTNASSNNQIVSTYDQKVNAFINDARWKNGISWGYYQKPKLSTYSSIGCCAYGADFAKYVFNKNSYRNGTYFTGVNNIKAGDILHLSQRHWIVVLYRNGNKLTTAEGNYSSKTCISSNKYVINGNYIRCNNSTNYTLSAGYHMQ